jgi:hypothetical protein
MGCVCTEPISYADDVLESWKNICSSILERDGKFGAYLEWKTAYLFVVGVGLKTLT